MISAQNNLHCYEYDSLCCKIFPLCNKITALIKIFPLCNKITALTKNIASFFHVYF